MGTDKLKLILSGKSVLMHSLLAFDRHPRVDELVIAAADEEFARSCASLLTKPWRLAPGGRERQDSVKNALACCKDEDIVLIHDGARPFVTSGCIDRCIDAVLSTGTGVCAVPVYDTLKRVDGHMQVAETLDRTAVYAMQTPQGFLGRIIKRAHRAAAGYLGTDDASLVERLGEAVTVVLGDTQNRKLTVREDLPLWDVRIGQGYDVHRLVEGRPCILCGLIIPHKLGLLGHSDADVAVHALMDAILGALALGDIGRHFPDTDPQYKDVSSMDLLRKVVLLAQNTGYVVGNCDLTIIAQAPKLQPYIDQMKRNLAEELRIPEDRVNVSATTTERLGFAGREEGIAAQAVVCMRGV